MNKLYQFKIWTLAALVFSLSACSSDEDASSKAAEELFNVERAVAFGPTETSWEVRIVADCEWEVTAVDNTLFSGPYRCFNPLYQKWSKTECDDPTDQERCRPEHQPGRF